MEALTDLKLVDMALKNRDEHIAWGLSRPNHNCKVCKKHG